MELFKVNSDIHFLGKRQGTIALVISLILLLMSFTSFFTQGFNFGIDFTGGTLVEVGYPQNVELGGVRDALTGSRLANAMMARAAANRSALDPKSSVLLHSSQWVSWLPGSAR